MRDHAMSGYFVLNQRYWYGLSNLYRQTLLNSPQKHDHKSTTLSTEVHAIGNKQINQKLDFCGYIKLENNTFKML